MEMFGASVAASPQHRTPPRPGVPRRIADGHGNIALAIAEAMEDVADNPGSRFCIGSGEDYSILHQTVIGEEAPAPAGRAGRVARRHRRFGRCGQQLRRDRVPVPRGAAALGPPGPVRGGRAGQLPQAHPRNLCLLLHRLLRDHALEKMFTLGSRFVTPPMHAGGLRYDATSKTVSALFHHGSSRRARLYPERRLRQRAAVLRGRGHPAGTESAHAVHGGVQEALRATAEGRPACVLICVSGHGHFDLSGLRGVHDRPDGRRRGGRRPTRRGGGVVAGGGPVSMPATSRWPRRPRGRRTGRGGRHPRGRRTVR